MKRFMACLLAVSMLLSGCGMVSSRKHSVTPHLDKSMEEEEEVIAARSYTELRNALVELVHNGTENSVINLPDYASLWLEHDLKSAVSYVCNIDAIGAYAVEDISYELGTSGFVPAVAVKITYLHGQEKLEQIQTAEDMDAVWEKIGNALLRCDAGIVLLVDRYAETDLIQMVEDYAQANPESVMECPAVTIDVYPQSGVQRVLSLKFTYQNSRNDLRQMQNQVSPIFNAAALYVSGNGSDYQKYSQLYAFLMERFSEYQIKTSITPAYSLLHHGVGDSRAFAMVYARMCELAGLECRIVTGTRQGEPRSWNMVMDGAYYYHVDLLQCSEKGKFTMQTDHQMSEYVWDYSAYPACTGKPEEGKSEPAEESTGETVPASEPTEIETENILK